MIDWARVNHLQRIRQTALGMKATRLSVNVKSRGGSDVFAKRYPGFRPTPS